MRIINNLALASMASPAKALLEKLHTAIVRIAPERKKEFDDLYPEFTLDYIDCDKWILHVNDDKRIQISSFVIEFLWATAYAHFVFYTRVFQGKQFSARTEISLGSDPKVGEAMRLLKWAVEKLINKDSAPWPTDLPKPKMIMGDTSDEGVADEMALGSAACLIHHELGHVALGHIGGSEIQIENDADLHSWEWIIGDRRDYDAKDLSKRLLLLVHAYSVGIILDVHRGYTMLISHPRSIDRLFKLLTHFEVPENHQTYAYAFATLHLHLENTENRLPIQQAAYESFFESFDEVINHISSFPTIT